MAKKYLEAYLKEIEGDVIPRLREKVKELVEEKFQVPPTRSWKVADGVLKYFFSKGSLEDYVLNPRGRFGELVKSVMKEFEISPSVLEKVLTYSPTRKKRKRGGVIVTKVHHTYSKDDEFDIVDWEEKGPKLGVRVKPRRRKEEEGIGPPEFLISIIRTEKRDTFSSMKAWEDFWKREEFYSEKNRPLSWLVPYHLVRELLNEFNLEGKKVLEVGCGSRPTLLEALADKNIEANVVGTDFSREACKKAKSRFRTSEFIRMFHPYSRSPWKPNSFDYIFCVTTLHNLHRQAKGATLITLDQGLKKGGKLILIELSSRRRDVREVEQFLESMGYEIEKRRRKLIAPDKRESRAYVLIATKKEERKLPLEKWIVKSYLKDRRVGAALKTLANLENLSLPKDREKLEEKLSSLFEEVKKEDGIDVEAPPVPPPYLKPNFSEIRASVEKEILESYEESKAMFFKLLRERVEETFKEDDKLVEPCMELLEKAISFGISYQDLNEVGKKHDLTKSEITRLHQKAFWKLGLYIPPKGTGAEKLRYDDLMRMLGKSEEEFHKLVPVRPISFWLGEWSKVLYNEVSKKAEERYEKERENYEKFVKEWLESRRLRI